jgi:hypothetical protein
MSRSQPKVTNPAKKFFQWSGGSEEVEKAVKEKGKEISPAKYEGGKVVYYDKDEGINIEVDLPFTFLVLDELTTITGFHEPTQSGFWSNEVKDQMTGELVVRTKKGIVTRGTYADIKDEIKAQGGKYAKSVYIAFKDDEGELAIGNLKIAGAAMSAWIDFSKRFNLDECAVMITGAEQAKKGKNVYFTPIFEGRNVNSATDAIAKELDDKLQAYLSTYLSRVPDYTDVDRTVEDEPEQADEIEDAGEVENLGDAPKKASTKATEPTSAPEPETTDDGSGKPVNLADVPF